MGLLAWQGEGQEGVLLPLPPKGTLRGTRCLENGYKDRMRQMQPPAPPHCSALEGTLHPVPRSVHSDGGAGNSHIPECSLALRGIRYMTALSWGVPSPPPSGGRCDPPEGVSSSPTLKGQLLAMSTLPSHPLVPRPGVVLVHRGERAHQGNFSHLQQGTGHYSLSLASATLQRCSQTPGWQEGRTDR